MNDYSTDLTFLNELAFAYYFTGEYEEAVEVYDKIEKQVGINESLTTQKVQLYTNIGKKDEAVAEYERLINLFPDESRYYALLAEYCAKNQMNEKAIWAYEKIVGQPCQQTSPKGWWCIEDQLPCSCAHVTFRYNPVNQAHAFGLATIN